MAVIKFFSVVIKNIINNMMNQYCWAVLWFTRLNKSCFSIDHPEYLKMQTTTPLLLSSLEQIHLHLIQNTKSSQNIPTQHTRKISWKWQSPSFYSVVSSVKPFSLFLHWTENGLAAVESQVFVSTLTITVAPEVPFPVNAEVHMKCAVARGLVV